MTHFIVQFVKEKNQETVSPQWRQSASDLQAGKRFLPLRKGNNSSWFCWDTTNKAVQVRAFPEDRIHQSYKATMGNRR